MASDDLLVATELVAGYTPEVNILNGLELTLGPNEFVGIIGPNGAGKSTFLKAVLGLVPVRSGTVVFEGEDITGNQAHQLVQKGVGFVPQSRNVFPSLTVSENLEMGSYLRPSVFKERVEYVFGLFPRLGRAGVAARRLAVGRRAPDGGHGPGADAVAEAAAPRRAVGRACRRCCRTRCSCSASRSTRRASPS